jgi:integrase
MLTCIDGESADAFWSCAERETTRQRSTVEPEAQTPKIDSRPVQHGLPVMAQDRSLATRKRSQSAESRRAPEPLLAIYDQRVANRWSARSRQQYRWILRNVRELASNLAGHTVGILEILRDESLLGQTLASATTADGRRTISDWVVANRRSGLRSFIDLMEPELRREGLPDAGEAMTRALRSVAEPVGTGYRLPGGRPRGRGGPTPSPEEISAIQDELSRKPGWRGIRNEIILSLMIRRGLRVGGLLSLDGANVFRLPDGRIRCSLRAKSKREPYELAVPEELTELLPRYIAQFNAWAKASGLADRIGIGIAGRFWRSDLAHPLTYQAWTKELNQACSSVALPVYSSHAFRRAFATTMTATLPRTIVATAGNWSSTRLMDDHYVQPSLKRLRPQLAKLPSRPGLTTPALESETPTHEPVGAGS